MPVADWTKETIMRRKTIISGFKNSQRFRVLFRNGGSEYDVGMYMTIKQMSDDMATVRARTAVWDAMDRLSHLRWMAKINQDPLPVGLTHSSSGIDVQVDLVD